jgi:hypothetical protein
VVYPALFLEGTRDSLCDLTLLASLLPQWTGPSSLKVIEGGDHSFKVPKSLYKSQASVFAEMMTAALDWMARLDRP